MAGLTEERLRVAAIVHALKAVGIRVKNWKNFLNAERNCEQISSQESTSPRFAFGRELHLLPQKQLSDMGGTVPQFLVEACEYLSHHLDTEGLFRKTGSLNRIRALRADLEQGKPIFLPQHADALQPCDVASLIKQFLRELPSPLIPTDLHVPLIQAQGLEMTHDQEGARNRTTLLITALFPSSQARALRYICTFLRQVAERCSKNRMDASSLAVVFAPNLLQCPTQPGKLTLDTEKHLDQQTSVIKSFILHVDRIGAVPSCMMEALKGTRGSETPSPAGGAVFSRRTGLSVYRSLRRQRRRSVGEIFVDAFSKLKPCRTPTGPPTVLDVTSVTPLSKSPTPQSPFTVKRKATEESVPETEGSAKKRRSLHDLREDTMTPTTQPEDSVSHSPLEGKCSNEDPIPTTSKKRNHTRETLRPPAQEEKVHRRRRSLRFFTVSGGSNNNHLAVTPTHQDLEKCVEEHQEQPDCKSGSLLTSAEVPKIPLIQIDAPERVVVVGNVVDDDPDLLNCSFAESPKGDLNTVSEASPVQRQDSEEPCDEECWTILEHENLEPLVECEITQSDDQNEGSQMNPSTKVENEPEVKQLEEKPRKESKKVKNSKNRSRPRRSISLPEVTLDSCTDHLEKEVGRAETEMENSVWPMFSSLTLSHDQENGNVVIKEALDTKESAKTLKNYKQDKMTDSTLGFKRPHQRMSMAERLRGFSALTLLLRTSRTAPQFREKPQESLQRGGTRLRRQGARRFGRSISHEGVSERALEQSPVESPPANQAFIGILDGSPDSGVESVDHEPMNDLLQEGCKRSQNSSKAQHIDEVDTDSLNSLGNPNQDLVLSASDKTEFEFLCKRTEQDVEELDKLLDQKCRIGGHEEIDQDSTVLTPDLASPMFLQQMVPLNLFGDTSSVEDFKTSEASTLHESDTETPSWLNASPPFEFSPFAPLTCDGVISEADTNNRLPCDLSPPTFQFRRVTTRRHYRDSPRWLSHEVRMSAWNPLPL